MTSFFNDILTTIAERGRALIDFSGRERAARGGDLTELFEALLSERGEASGMAIAQEIFERYDALDEDARHQALDVLASAFGVDLEVSRAAAETFLDAPDDATGRALNIASEPRRQELFRRLNLAPDGTARLVAMREDLIDGLGGHPQWRPMDADFAHLFSSWFNRGFLVLRRIDWQTPAAILEKIIRYEAVHEIADWDDLRRRIDPPDRRLYAFFHPRLVDEPLIFVEVALTGDIPAAIGPVLADDREPIDPRTATVATFYSISNCQRGLKGVTFGSFLIKQVVAELSRELPSLRTFVTLSPIPSFADWLAGLAGQDDEAEGEVAIGESERASIADALAAREDARSPDAGLETSLTQLAAAYLLTERDRRARPRDPVARFHLGNGAILDRVNWAADDSPRGLGQSFGLMVNYRYEPDEIEANHEAYAHDGTVAAAPRVHRLARGRGVARRERTTA